MRRVGTTFLLVFVTWFILTFTLEPASVIAGILICLAITLISRHLLSRDTPKLILHPMRWVGFLAYLALMVYLEIRAHIDVGMRVFTGNIRPAIIEVPIGLHTSLGKTLMGNSITMTPGTLTVKAKHETKFYVHTLSYRKGMDIGGIFRRYGRRVIG
jgi:multicomponent Na+:H+ antiporter subunit E